MCVSSHVRPLSGWTSVTVNCDEMGREVRDELCETSLKPKVSRILCNIDPC